MGIWLLHALPPHGGFGSFMGRLGIYSLFVGKIPTKRRKCGYTERIISYIPNYPENTLGCALIWGISRHFSLIYPIVSLHILRKIRADTHFIHVHLLLFIKNHILKLVCISCFTSRTFPSAVNVG